MSEPFGHIDFFFRFRPTRGFSVRQAVQVESTLCRLNLRDAYVKRIERKNREFTSRILKLHGIHPRKPKRTKLWRKSPLSMLDQCERLLARWRTLIRRMDDADANSGLAARIPWTARNCQPAFFPTRSRSDVTCYCALCPFCHARRVWEYYQRVVYTLAAAEWQGTLVQQFIVVGDYRSDKVRPLIAGVQRAFDLQLRYQRRRPSPDGVVSFIQVLPPPKANIARVQLSQLVYWRTAQPRMDLTEWPEALQGESRILPVESLTESRVRHAVCSVLRYPPGWIYRPAPVLMRVLGAIRDRNVLTASGVFHRKLPDMQSHK